MAIYTRKAGAPGDERIRKRLQNETLRQRLFTCGSGVACAAIPGLPPARCTSADATAIPDRPEKLYFPPLDYEPPEPDAIIACSSRAGRSPTSCRDRELPLVNIAIYVRTGDYVEPEGKEGLAELTGYLLARGGTKSKTAEELEERLAFLAANSAPASATPRAASA